MKILKARRTSSSGHTDEAAAQKVLKVKLYVLCVCVCVCVHVCMCVRV